jgi:glycosyltransferase
MKESNNLNSESLIRIARYLMLHGSSTSNIGLLNGKMGIILFFYELGRYTGRENYDIFAGELLDEVYDEINNEAPLHFRDGLCGIGWGMEYLIRNGFIEADSDDVLDELDKRIVEWDVRKIIDSSLRTGLAGIACYVASRKNGLKNNGIITDDYCRDLKEALEKCNEKEAEKLAEILEKILNGKSIESLYNPVLQIVDEIKINIKEGVLFEKPRAKGVDNNGFAGIGLRLIKDLNGKTGKSMNVRAISHSHVSPTGLQTLFQTVQMPENRIDETKRLLIFTMASRAANYGIGAYIDNLIEALQNSNIEFGLVLLHSGINEVKIIEKEGYRKIEIPSSAALVKNAGKYYHRNVAYLLKEFIPEEKGIRYIFHLNFMGNADFVKQLKKIFHGKVIQVAHYTDWSFMLLGDFNKMKALNSRNLRFLKDPKDKAVVKMIKEDIKTLNRADKTVFVSKHTFDSYMSLGGLKNCNAEIINNALKDKYIPISSKEKSELRKQYLIGENEKIILFAGRLDEVKGVKYLISAFKKVLSKNPTARLIIAGDGNFNELLKESSDYWPKINFTGRLDKVTLYNFYRIADVGVVCSLHEEFGLVAIEMMMNALPIIVTKTSGLDEIVEDGVSGLKVPVRTRKGIRKVDVNILAEKIDFLLNDYETAKSIGRNARKRFLDKYELSLFRKKMLTAYNAITKK